VESQVAEVSLDEEAIAEGKYRTSGTHFTPCSFSLSSYLIVYACIWKKKKKERDKKRKVNPCRKEGGWVMILGKKPFSLFF
jgi:hypothetical protein